jgi:hypothetical protein
LEEFNVKYGSVLSLTGRTGFKVGKFRLGGLGEVHSSDGNVVDKISYYDSATQDYYRFTPEDKIHSPRIRILTGGPEMVYEESRFQARVYGKWILNGTEANLDDLGDVVSRGSGRGGFGGSLSVMF